MLAQAVILCGGLGTRLGDLTRETPKPLLPVGDRPFLEHLVHEVARVGVREIVLLAGRFGEKVRAAFDGRKLWGASLRVLVEPVPLGTGGALRFAEEALEETFFVLNGDSWIDADLVEAALHWSQAERDSPALAGQMLLRHVLDARRYGSVSIEGGLVRGFAEKRDGGGPVPGLVNAGIYILHRSLVSSLDAGREISLERDVFPVLAGEGRIAGHVVPADRFFIDIGVPDDYARAQTDVPAARRRPALLLDLDCILLREKATPGPDALVWRPGAREAIARANARGRLVFVLSDADGAGRGVVAHREAVVQADLFRLGAHVDAFGLWRRQETGEAETIGLSDLLGAWPVDGEQSLAVGSNEPGLAAARAAGLPSVLCGTGSGDDLLAGMSSD